MMVILATIIFKMIITVSETLMIIPTTIIMMVIMITL